MKKLIPIIGLEIHTELLTKTKMFCSCPNAPFISTPNSNICPICTGQPGTLPVPNKEAIVKAYLVGKALSASLRTYSKFDRKHYFYPDLPKGYQISQYDLPFSENGFLEVEGERISIIRIHLEEDTGKLLHSPNFGYSLLDLNRAGVPLLELVTAPMINSAFLARRFCEEYQQLLRDLKVANADMEKGEMRCEANVSLQEEGSFYFEGFQLKAKPGYSLNPKVEIKNLNSFRAVEKAIEYEIERQKELLYEGKKIIQETRGFDERLKCTVSQREKESAKDYRYFPEPDIPPIVDFDLSSLKLPLLTKTLRVRLLDLGLDSSQAELIAKNREIAELVIEGAKQADPKVLANIYINRLKLKPSLPAKEVIELAKLISAGKLPAALTGKLIELALKEKLSIKEAFSKKMEKSQASEKLIVDLIKKVIASEKEAVASYKKGKKEAIGVLIGKVLREGQGLLNPKEVKDLLEKELS